MAGLLGFLCQLIKVGEPPDQLSPCIAVKVAPSPSTVVDGFPRFSADVCKIIGLNQGLSLLLPSFCNFGEFVVCFCCFTIGWVIFELHFVVLV